MSTDSNGTWTRGTSCRSESERPPFKPGSDRLCLGNCLQMDLVGFSFFFSPKKKVPEEVTEQERWGPRAGR